jgi:hypothetical protein
MASHIDVTTPEPEPRLKQKMEDGCEEQYHYHHGNQFPWFVHVLWVCFWILAIWYIITYQLPLAKQEFLSPP